MTVEHPADFGMVNLIVKMDTSRMYAMTSSEVGVIECPVNFCTLNLMKIMDVGPVGRRT